MKVVRQNADVEAGRVVRKALRDKVMADITQAASTTPEVDHVLLTPEEWRALEWDIVGVPVSGGGLPVSAVEVTQSGRSIFIEVRLEQAGP